MMKDEKKSVSAHGTEELAEQLISQIHTTAQLKKISIAIETLTQTKSFKTRAREIAGDSNLPTSLKKSQLLELLSDIDIPVLKDFFNDILDQGSVWLFASKQFDYFDEFVRSFQMLTEKLSILHLVTAVELKESTLISITKEMNEALGEQVIIHSQVKPTIMGGAQIRLGNLVFDYSLKSKFNQFQRHWISKLSKTSAMVGRE